MNTWRRRETARGEAVRVKTRPWADPRLLCGLLCIAAATVMGGRLTASSAEQQQYWALERDVAAGQQAHASHLRAVPVDVASATAQQLVSVGQAFDRPLADAVWAHDLKRGQLLTRTALAASRDVKVRELPVHLEPGAAPHDLARGQHVDVWASSTHADGQASAVLVAERAEVRTLAQADALAASGRTVVLGVDAAAVTPKVVASIGQGHVTLVRVP
jgi:hypothetical protein